MILLLSGYEDARKKSIDGLNLIENSKINKSIYALLNVVHALAASESRVPFRESKLTRILQDSLGGAGRVLMLTCLVRVLYTNFLVTSLLVQYFNLAVEPIFWSLVTNFYSL